MRISNKIKMFGVVVFTVIAATFGLSSSVSASGMVTCPKGTLRDGDKVNSYAECNINKDADNRDLMGTISTVINVIIGIIGLVAVIVIILGGFQYMTSAGDSTKVKKSKDTILYGVIGLVISLLAYAIVNFVLGAL